jgi:hypothetical protein
VVVIVMSMTDANGNVFTSIAESMVNRMTCLQVSTDIDNENKWKECFVVGGIKLPIGYYIGATAATGELAGTK